MIVLYQISLYTDKMSAGKFHQCTHILHIHDDLWSYLHRQANALYYERWCENIISSLFNIPSEIVLFLSQ